jgi:alkanesulfonate monooxygenase SsuD/methylene tetrahydromethanopterin reductase-like flavin-dependent oxidoreductase (luciferase family)
VSDRPISLGIALWNQQSTWAELEAAAVRAEQLGYDHVWTWDHVYAIEGDPYQPTWEGYAALAALAKVTSRVRLGLFVGAITFRNPFIVAKALTTIDHASGGRAIAGLGAAWFELEHQAAGIDFGRSVGARLDWLDEGSAALRTLFDGGRVTSVPGGHYAFDDLVLLPPPVQSHLPILIGGGGLKKTLRIVAQRADMWNTGGDIATLTEQRDALYRHCEVIGRDPAQIELTCGIQPVLRASEAEAMAAWRALAIRNRLPIRDDAGGMWATTPERLVERLRERVALGFRTYMAEIPAPYDDETMERLRSEVAPALG